jgi:hypothetical protein
MTVSLLCFAGKQDTKAGRWLSGKPARQGNAVQGQKAFSVRGSKNFPFLIGLG